MSPAELFVTALGAYLAFGLALAAPFVAFGVGRIDPAARQGTRGFRLIIVPGTVLLWPLLLVRWVRGAGPPEERTPHKVLATPDARPAERKRP
jgi:hypothetical protein